LVLPRDIGVHVQGVQSLWISVAESI
jgi:hypothetical protein